MDIESVFERKRTGRKIRIKISTNKNVKFIIAVKPQATISDLANRALGVYLQLTGQSRLNKSSKKQLTVSAVKQGIFYMPKSEYVVNLLNCDDEVEVIIIKAKPKYPNQIFQGNQLISKATIQQRQINPEKIEVNNNRAVIVTESIQAKADIEQRVDVPHNSKILSEGEITEKMSKKQKKKQKMKLKKQNHRKLNEENNNDKNEKVNKDHKDYRELDATKKRQQIIMPESSSKKKVKLDKEEVKGTLEKLPITMPSPKITFHNEPTKIDSPKVSLTDSIKRKMTPDLQRPNEEIEKKGDMQKHNSPFSTIKSPLIIHRTPTPMSHQDEAKFKYKEELLNFSLPRKLSEDKRIEAKKEKSKEQSVIKKIEESKDAMNSSISELNLEKQILKPVKEVAKAEEIKPVKKATNLMVVQAEDSESEQNKKVCNYIHMHHRQKELNQIHNKINSFLFELEDED